MADAVTGHDGSLLMKCPTPCYFCGRLRELHSLRHDPICRSCGGGRCRRLACEKCFRIREIQGDVDEGKEYQP